MIDRNINRVTNYEYDKEVMLHLTNLYAATGNEELVLRESDLIIFRLMGVRFRYNEVEFC